MSYEVLKFSPLKNVFSALSNLEIRFEKTSDVLGDFLFDQIQNLRRYLLFEFMPVLCSSSKCIWNFEVLDSFDIQLRS